MKQRSSHPAFDRSNVVDLIDEYEAKYKNGTLPFKPGKGRPRTHRGMGRAQVARQLGLSNKTVSDIDRAIGIKRADDKKMVGRNAIHFERFGLDIGDEWMAEISVIILGHKEVERRIKAAIGCITRLENKAIEAFDMSAMVRLRRSLQEDSELVRAMYPRSLCPYCKGQDGVQDRCKPCAAKGWVGKMGFVPSELLDKKTLRVHDRGKSVLLVAEAPEIGMESMAPIAEATEEIDW